MRQAQGTWRDRCLVACAAVVFLSGVASAGEFEASSYRELRDIKARLQATHFLSMATFGPAPADVDALAARIRRIGRRRALNEWIDKQFTTDASHHKSLATQMLYDDGFTDLNMAGINQRRYRQYAWWHNAVAAPDQLRQRVAWALAQIFVINQSGANFGTIANDPSGDPYWLGICNYYDMLVDNSFGNYRDVMHDVTMDPVMGVFLSHAKNPKGNGKGRYPDENYAREIEQLMSIGLYEMYLNGVFKKDKEGKLIDTYDNEDIKAFARVFTGLSYGGGTSFYGAKRNLNQPMEMYETYHDTDEKVLLKGTVLPAGQTGMKDINDALDNLFQHANTAPFVSRLLIQRMTASNPSKGYIRRVARKFMNNGHGERGDMKAVVKAILTDREALNSQRYVRLRRPYRLIVLTRGTERSRLREPVLRYAALVRAFNGTSDYPSGRFMMYSQYSNMQQAPYEAPHVFNFYLPDYQPPGPILDYTPSRRIPNGALYAPEFEIFTSVTANRFANRLRSDIRDATMNFTLINNQTAGKRVCNIALDFSDAETLAADPMALMTHLDMLLCHGSMSQKHKQLIADILALETSDVSRARGAILGVMTLPATAIDP